MQRVGAGMPFEGFGGVARALTVGLIASSTQVGCAAVTAVPLEADGLSRVEGAEPGFRYYMPRPYLLVARMPAAGGSAGGGLPKQQNVLPSAPPPPVPGKGGAAVAPPAEGGGDAGKAGAAPPQAGAEVPKAVKSVAPGAPGAAPAAPANPGAQQSSQQGGQQQTAPAPASDLSFAATNGTTYVAKLIYLPDYSRPMAVNMNTGLLGTTSVQLTIQDGWMLTNVSANADNSKAADVLTAAIQALSSAGTGGASKAASAATSKAPGGGPQGTVDQVLRPGLYAFDYEYALSRVTSVCAVAYFDSSGSRPTRPGDPGACGPDFSRPAPAVLRTLG